jgi:hypothetical protein
MPVLNALEKKYDMMRELKPSLDSLVKDISEITSFDDMRAAKEGGKVIKKILDISYPTSLSGDCLKD